MDGFINIPLLALYGVKDFFLGIGSLTYFWSQKNRTEASKSLLDVLIKCSTFSGLFLFGILLFEHFILIYGIKLFLECTLGPDWQYLSRYCNFLELLFKTFWTLPLFLLNKVLLNLKWCNEIAELTFDNVGGKRRASPKLSYSWADQLESAVVQCVFMVQAYVLFWFPVPQVLQDLWCHLHLSLLYALYSFEYKWFQMGWGLRRRLAYIGSKWPYFLGFGLPLTLISWYIGSSLESVCLFSTLFPLYVVSSTVTVDSRVQHNCYSLNVFKPASSLVSFLFVFLCSYIHR